MEEYIWIDDCFRIVETQFKTWNSYHKEGGKLITSLTEEQCINATRFYLKGKQEGGIGTTSNSYEGVVSGKL